MEGQFLATREELYHVQMEVKHVQGVQLSHADRLLRLEKRQADDAALKSVWNSPFPSVLSGTPQHGPTAAPSADVFEDFDEDQGQNLLSSLHLDAEDEPTRRGTSRANSVRFDVSADQGSSWAQGSRLSREFSPARPSSGFGSHPMTERSLSHKSDGRHSSTGHSVHSAQSGRTSSLGLDTNFMIGDPHDDIPLSIPEPPPGLFVLGTVPSIIRCWLNDNFSHAALLYAVICTGSQRSQVDLSLLKELELFDQVQKDSNGHPTISLPVYLPEAVVTQPTSRSNSPGPHIPAVTARFEVVGDDQQINFERKNRIRIFLGSDTLRAHNADILFSQNVLTLYGDDRDRLSVPFVRPEDDKLFRDLATINMTPEKVELKATAAPFMPTDSNGGAQSFKALTPAELLQSRRSNESTRVDEEFPEHSMNISRTRGAEEQGHENSAGNSRSRNSSSEPPSGPENAASRNPRQIGVDETDHPSGPDSERSEPSGGIWGSWRSGGVAHDSDAHRENYVPSSYNKAGRGGRSMKVLKPSKAPQGHRSTSSARTGASYEPAPQSFSGEYRRKSQTAMPENGGTGPLKWESKRTVSDEKAPKDLRGVSTSRSSNPIGGASAFAWMNSGKPRSSSIADE